MFLKSLSLRGFKSFADKTTLQFEPGITIVVGPNGSGKSNVVDAISWVLGEQGPRSLRGGKMQDVIFAGSRLRPALAMAEVTLTIDNSAGLLPIEFNEVTVSRLLFRSGDSEYRLNGAPCRLLDIQEVLSDSGIGREQHTIIGQGQLDAVLSADPMQMRGFIEEAGGVAKHRRRKDRALRKIAATEQNLVRLGDLLSEIRRQLRPLREQAEVAKRFTAIEEELSRLSLIAAARELMSVRQKLGSGEQIDIDALIRAGEAELSATEQQLTLLESDRESYFRQSEIQRELAWRFSRAGDRIEALARLAHERQRTLEAELGATTEAAMDARVRETRRQIEEAESRLEDARQWVLESERLAEEAASALSRSTAVMQELSTALAPARAAQREAIAESARIRGDLASLEAALLQKHSEVATASERSRGLEEELVELRRRSEEESGHAAEREATEAALMQELDAAGRREAEADEALTVVRANLADIEKEAATWRARAEGRQPVAREVLEPLLRMDGVLGVLGDLVDGRDHRAALDAVAGNAGSVLVVDSEEAAARVLESRAGAPIAILVPRAAPSPEGLTSLAVAVGASGMAADALSGIFLAATEGEAARLAFEHPGGIFVTNSGAVAVGPMIVTTTAGQLERAEELERTAAGLRADVERFESERAAARASRDAVTERLNALDSEVAASAERLAGIERDVHALTREMQVVANAESAGAESIAELERKLESVRRSVPGIESELETRGAEIEQLEHEIARAEASRETAAAAHGEARFEVERAAERVRLLEEQLHGSKRALEQIQSAAAGIEERRAFISEKASQAGETVDLCRVLKVRVERWAADAESSYQSVRSKLNEAEGLIAETRSVRGLKAGEVNEMRVRAREEDLGRTELKIKVRILEERISTEWGQDPAELVEKYGHVWEVEDPSALPDPLARAAAMDEESLRRRRTRLERDIEQMGRVNPLAAQEFEHLTEREQFLAAQMADVRASRRDLYKVVASVDEQIKDLFGSAFEDVRREYELLFAMLFPGGQGRLRLTEPSDLLHTGVEVEARPGGKNLKRLSLLSGGERALSALAVLFAIFRARPSPFYVLDEVEAALDDVNLHRFLELLREFRASSQLLVVTHQKRTMEAADVLYGVSIRPDGASRVISQKLQDAPDPSGLSGRVNSSS